MLPQKNKRIEPTLRGLKMESVITAQTILEYTGEDSLLHVDELILRERGCVGFEAGCLDSLSQLQMLSLSHNLFVDVSYFGGCFVNLVVLNLNYNSIVHVDGLRGCHSLEKLYLAGNSVVDISPLSSLTRMATLCLYRNSISSLEGAFPTIRSLTRLKELDLDGNPLSNDGGYKHAVIRQFPRLSSLDGKGVTPLDKELAEDYFKKRGAAKAARPSTAPAPSSFPGASHPERGVALGVTGDGDRQGRGQGGDREKEGPHTSHSDDTAQFTRLYESDELNKDPIALRYLAESMLSSCSINTFDIIEEKGEEIAAREEEDRRTRPKSFVDRIRKEAHTSTATGSKGGSHLPSLPGATHSPVVGGEDSGATVTLRQSTMLLKEDWSDPHAIIRKLLKNIEMMQAERDMLMTYMERGEGGGGGGSNNNIADLNLELSILKAENANMYTMMEENKDLKAKVAGVQGAMEEAEALRGEVGNLKRKITALQSDNAALVDENNSLKQEAMRASMKEQLAVSGSRSSGASTSGTPTLTPRSYSFHDGSFGLQGRGDMGFKDLMLEVEMEEEEDVIEAEIADLLSRNADSLRQIRQDTNSLKKEILRAETISTHMNSSRPNTARRSLPGDSPSATPRMEYTKVERPRTAIVSSLASLQIGPQYQSSTQ